MITWRRPTDDELIARGQAFGSTPLTYAEVGATEGDLPDGYHHGRYERELGSGDAVWSAATAAVMDWSPHTHADVRVVPSSRPTEGAVVVLAFRVGPVNVVAPARVVLIADAPDRVGFAYGTLPGHPERGEESFMVQRRPDGTVVFVITVFSRPGDLSTRLAGPIAREIQRRVTTTYLDGLTAACSR